MKRILKSQTVGIDFHKPGQPAPRWDDLREDIHLHKHKNGKKDKYDIRIPLNSDREVTVSGQNVEVPTDIRNEVANVFRNKRRRNEFVAEIIDSISRYENAPKGADVEPIVHKIANAFGLDWRNQFSALAFTPSTKRHRIELFDEEDGTIYFVSISPEGIKAGDTARVIVQRNNN